MTVTVASFRANFAAFASAASFPDAEVTFWLTLALKCHDAGRYGDMLDEATQLFIAHMIALEAQSRVSVASGQGPGQVQGPLTGASVNKVSYSRNPGVATDPSAGHWNLTTYGIRWRFIQRLVGAGPVQIGTPSAGDDAYPGAWPGPIRGW